MEIAALVAALIVVLLIVLTVGKTVRIVPQARARNVERFGRYRKTLEPGMNFILRSWTGSSPSSTCGNRWSRSGDSR